MTSMPSSAERMESEETNLAGLVLRHAAEKPDHPALIVPTDFDAEKVLSEEVVTYGELAERVSRLRAGLADAGIFAGDRVVVMFGVRTDLYVLVLALLASGVAVVLIDTGMGKKGVIQALKLADAKAIVSMDDVLRHRMWLRALWGLKRYSVDRARWGVRHLSELEDFEPSTEPPRHRPPQSPGLITFTSGTSGQPKGANRTHDLLIAQHHALAEHFPATDDEVDMPCFPVVVLHNLCCGITTVIPAVDFRAPAKVEPEVVVSQIKKHGVTRVAGAPAYLTRIADHLRETGEELDTVRTVGCGGAPTPTTLCEKLVETLPEAEKLIIYGSTEAEPVSSTTMEESLEADGEGYLVGRLAKAATVALVKLPDLPPVLDEREMNPFEVAPGEVGELVVRGPHVLRGYVDNREADKETKLPAPDGGVWHRTRDLARVDDDGRYWLLGRTNDVFLHAGLTVYPFPIEAKLDAIEGVRYSAVLAHPLAASGEVLLQLKVGVASDKKARAAVVDEVRRWLDDHGFQAMPLELISEMPVDARHNSKIDRVTLRRRRQRKLAR